MEFQDIYIEEFEEKLVLMENYFKIIGDGNFLKALNKFAQEEGYGSVGAMCNFASYYEPWEEGYFGESGVEIRVGAPSGPDEVAILDIETFYSFLAEEIKNYLMKYPKDKEKVEIALVTIKNRFSIS